MIPWRSLISSIAVLREIVSKEAVYIAVDISEDGSKEMLAYTIAPTESAYKWREIFKRDKRTCCCRRLIVYFNGLKGMTDTVFIVFPKSKIPSEFRSCCTQYFL